MIWIVLAALGIPLWFVLGGLASTLWWRRRFRRRPEVFACRVRSTGPTETSGWPRTKRYAYWAHDVLLVHQGAALIRYEPLPVSSVVGPAEATAVKGLDEQPIMWELHLADGRVLDLATRNQDVVAATGPFAAAPPM